MRDLSSIRAADGEEALARVRERPYDCDLAT